MSSWQAKLLKVYFCLRHFRLQATGEADVNRERAQLEALATGFKPLVAPECVTVMAHDVPAEWVIPPLTSSGRVVFYIHGGGYSIGSINSHRALAANIASAAQARVLLTDYRLAPEYPYPAAVSDALTTYQWLLDNGVAPDRIAVAGDSSGGGLALALLVSLRDAGEPLPAAAICLSPWTDLAATGETWTTKVRTDLVLYPRVLQAFTRWYLGDVDPYTSLASPLYADLTSLPPLLIQVGSDEILLSDSTRLAERARSAGVDVTLEVWEGMQHVWHFAASLLPEGRQAIQRIGEFIEQSCP